MAGRGEAVVVPGRLDATSTTFSSKTVQRGRRRRNLENLHLYRSQTGLSDYGRKYVTFPRMVGRAQAFEMFTHTNPCEHDYMGRTKLLRWNGMEWDKIFQRGQFPGATWFA